MDIEHIFKEFCSNYRVKFHPQKKHIAKVTSPFAMMDGDPISFIVEIKDEHTIVMHDDLLIYRYFDINYYDPSNNALDMASSIIASYGIKEDEHRFAKVIDIRTDDINDEITDYLAGLIRLSDLTFLKRDSIKKEFSEIVSAYIRENIKTKYSYYGEGIASLDGSSSYPVDMAFSNDNETWVALFLLSNQSKISEATISTMHYKYVKHQKVFTMSIFDDIDTILKSSKTKRLINLTNKPIIDFNDESKEIILKAITDNL